MASTQGIGGEVAVRDIGPMVRARRHQLGMTLEQLGALAEIDVSHLSRIERGAGATTPETLDRILFEIGLALRLVRRPLRRSPRKLPQRS